MIVIPEISQLPGQIEAALQFLRFAEEIQYPHSFDSMPRPGRELSRTEFEVMDWGVENAVKSPRISPSRFKLLY